MSKTKTLVGGKTLSLWIPDEEWVDDFNHLLIRQSKADRSLTRNAFLLQCVEAGLQHYDERQDLKDCIRIDLESFPEEQATLLRTPAGKQLVSNLISALLAGQLSPLQHSTIEVAATSMIKEEVVSDNTEQTTPSSVVPEKMETAPPEKSNEKFIPDLFHSLMRNSSFN